MNDAIPMWIFLVVVAIDAGLWGLLYLLYRRKARRHLEVVDRLTRDLGDANRRIIRLRENLLVRRGEIALGGNAVAPFKAIQIGTADSKGNIVALFGTDKTDNGNKNGGGNGAR